VEGRASTMESIAKAGAARAATGTTAAPLTKAALATWEAWFGEKAADAATRAKRVTIWKVFMVLFTIIIYFVLKVVTLIGVNTVQMERS